MKINKLFFIIYILFSFDNFADYIDQKAICNQENGVWRIFNNSCYDNCEKEIDKNTPCYKILKYNCDCGQDRCWKDNKCVNKDSVKKRIYSTFEERKVKTIVKTEKEEEKTENTLSNRIIKKKDQHKKSLIDFVTGFGKKEKCQNAGGKLAEFRNSCADKCGTDAESFCAQIITESCDCGPIRCWDGKKCTTITK